MAVSSRFTRLAVYGCSFFFWLTGCLPGDEGMYPVSEIGKLNLPAQGLKMLPGDIFNPNQACLIDGICKVNGCTGSFVSPQGLIITNHHCAYRAIQSASTTENNFLADGFQARTLADEIPAKGYTVRITEAFSDVSEQVLAVLEEGMGFAERTKAIDQRRKELEKTAEEANSGMRAEVAEMFAGKTYVLFLYTYITDVRLVFAPPASVGEFGGDTDNWEWPRHTGDFTFLRAYVAPDGSTADYAKENVPYQPKRFIQVDPNGVDEGDFVMLIGYPGRTARHKTASFLTFEEQVRLPFIVDLYGWQIDQMEAAGQDNRAVALKLTSRIKSLANVEKRSRGQLKGLRRANIAAGRAAGEADLQAYIDADPERKKQYGDLLSEINNVYAEMGDAADFELNLQNLISASRMMNLAFTLYDSAVEREKPDLEREAAYMDRNFDLTRKRQLLGQQNIDPATDKILLSGMLDRLAQVPAARAVDALRVAQLKDNLRSNYLDSMYSQSWLIDGKFVEDGFDKNPSELKELDDPFLNWVIELYPHYLELREKGKERNGRLDQLYGELVAVKQQYQNANFVPDANATLRITFGHVKGYSPEDAVYKSPVTSLSGVIDKTTGQAPFITPQKIIDMHAKQQFGRYRNEKLNDVPVAILYDTDTTGGNSGSPILNAEGELVGVNFDRAFEATINDFAWNESYSRSIGVDIRYVLWITGDVFGASHLLKEMGVE
ncbi:MAG: S46 family peptidase [Planctomycetota bacterium]|nr:S46 family peptidase [Planctomycetota bacterium]